MRYLLDTHVAVWAVSETHRIPPALRRRIDDTGNRVFVSVVNLLEIAAKHGTGRRSAPTISATQLLQLVENSDFSMLPVLPEHAVAVERLPNLHGDPFDRLLVAQAMVEDLRLITHDERVAAYDRTIILF